MAPHHFMRTGGQVGHQADDAVGNPGNDVGEQDHGNAVANAELGDLLAQPHDQGGAGSEGQDDDHIAQEVGISQRAMPCSC